jgi:serine/threonine protein phosphatase 1
VALYAIGDIHGCARTLDALLDEIQAGVGDTLVFVGDYVDRGPDSRGVIERLLQLEATAWNGQGPVCVFLRGNHDQMMLDYVDGRGDYELWRVNGGLTTLESYAVGGEVQIPPAHIAFLRWTSFVYDSPDFAFVHAGMDPRRTVAENLVQGDIQTFLWSREHLKADLSKWEKAVVCGHTPVTEPIDLPQLIGIDTGAVFATRPGLGRLTAVQLPERRYITVPYTG